MPLPEVCATGRPSQWTLNNNFSFRRDVVRAAVSTTLPDLNRYCGKKAGRKSDCTNRRLLEPLNLLWGIHERASIQFILYIHWNIWEKESTTTRCVLFCNHFQWNHLFGNWQSGAQKPGVVLSLCIANVGAKWLPCKAVICFRGNKSGNKVNFKILITKLLWRIFFKKKWGVKNAGHARLPNKNDCE